MPHDDDRGEREGRSKHAETLALLRDLRGDTEHRIIAIIQDQTKRNVDSLEEARREREWIRGELNKLQSRIEQTIDYLR